MMIHKWQAISLKELTSLFKVSEKPFWISGGEAIDLFLGKNTRAHDDLDVCIKRSDQLDFQHLFKSWNLQASDPPGSGKLRTWREGEFLNSPVHNVWCGKNLNGPWNLELLLCEFEGDEWVYRRNSSIRGPVSEFGWGASNGMQMIAPEIQLLYKSRNPREKDRLDFENCLPVFSPQQRNWLRSAILIDSGQLHPWIKHL
jgi:hypothetical protein